ncbi:MAG: hypothetical protein NVS4B3_10060 [Gemmatimonadaceae bacterium]
MQLCNFVAAGAAALFVCVCPPVGAQTAAGVQGDSLPRVVTDSSTGRSLRDSGVYVLAPVRVEAEPEPPSLGSRVWHYTEDRQAVLDARRENRRLERELSDCDEKIERLEIRLARAKAVHDSLHATRVAAKPEIAVPVPGVNLP